MKSSLGVLGRQYTLSYMFSLCCGIVGEAKLAAPNVEVEALAAPGLKSGLVFLEVEVLDVPDLAVELAALDVGVEALAVSGLDAGVALLAVGVLVVAELEADLAEPASELEAGVALLEVEVLDAPELAAELAAPEREVEALAAPGLEAGVAHLSWCP